MRPKLVQLLPKGGPSELAVVVLVGEGSLTVLLTTTGGGVVDSTVEEGERDW